MFGQEEAHYPGLSVSSTSPHPSVLGAPQDLCNSHRESQQVNNSCCLTIRPLAASVASQHVSFLQGATVCFPHISLVWQQTRPKKFCSRRSWKVLVDLVKSKLSRFCSCPPRACLYFGRNNSGKRGLSFFFFFPSAATSHFVTTAGKIHTPLCFPEPCVCRSRCAINDD